MSSGRACAAAARFEATAASSLSGQKKSSRPLFARDVHKGRSGRIGEKLRKMYDFLRATPVKSDGFTNSEEAVAAAGHGSRPCWLKCCPCPSRCSLSLSLSLIGKKYLFCALHISLPLFPLSLYPTLRSLAVVPAAHSSLDMTADKEDKDGSSSITQLTVQNCSMPIAQKVFTGESEEAARWLFLGRMRRFAGALLDVLCPRGGRQRGGGGGTSCITHQGFRDECELRMQE